MTPEEIDINLAELTTRLERVRALYEQYFMGFERVEPAIPRKDVERRVQDLRKVRFQNTAKRFKFQTLVQRYNSLQQYWGRVCRDIENGTYRRHVLKAERRFAEEDLPESTAALSPDERRERAGTAIHAKENTEHDLAAMLDGGVDLEAELGAALRDVENARPPTGKLAALGSRDTSTVNKLAGLKGRDTSTGGRLATGPKVELPPRQNPLGHLTPKKPVPTSEEQNRPSPKAPSGSLSEEQIRAIHRSYSDARSKTNATAVSYEKLQQSLRETERKLREQNKGKSVEFEVSIRDGKAVLKPKLK